jgi:HSP90 family molecular chaperone
LLKNSYDAGASKVTVILDSSQKTLQIIDDGSGMDKNDIDTLFHISNSTKKYGQINEYGRYTQGSKGLGFLSVFKFGRHVEWKTRKKNGLIFKVNYNSLLEASDISQFEIEITENNTIDKGTSITILLDEYNASSLESYFTIEKNYKKVLNAFDDKNFIIELHISGMKYSSCDTLPLTSNAKEHQLYYVTYDSDKQKIKFFYNNSEILSEIFF